LLSKETMLAASARTISRKARIGNIIQYPALFFAKLAQGRLEKHWGTDLRRNCGC